MKILFLASGNGGTMKFIHHAIKELNLNAEIVAVLSDRECGSVDYALANNIPCKVIKPWKEKTTEIIEEIKKYTPDTVITNIHKILPPDIFSCGSAKFINLHYSLLPAFGGVIGFKTLELAKGANTKIIGVTCHYVTEELDGGKVISQAAIPVDWDSDFAEIGNKIFQIACETILNGIFIISGQNLSKSVTQGVIYSPKLNYDNSVFTDDFWKMISEI